jgi:hypothetical protein
LEDLIPSVDFQLDFWFGCLTCTREHNLSSH